MIIRETNKLILISIGLQWTIVLVYIAESSLRAHYALRTSTNQDKKAEY